MFDEINLIITYHPEPKEKPFYTVKQTFPYTESFVSQSTFSDNVDELKRLVNDIIDINFKERIEEDT